MALPALIQNTDQTKISEILQENNSYLEEIQTVIEAEYSVVNDNSDILNNQLEILEVTATRDRLDADNEEHNEFKAWVQKLEEWIVDQIYLNHSRWFGHMWEDDGPLVG